MVGLDQCFTPGQAERPCQGPHEDEELAQGTEAGLWKKQVRMKNSEFFHTAHCPHSEVRIRKKNAAKRSDTAIRKPM